MEFFTFVGVITCLVLSIVAIFGFFFTCLRVNCWCYDVTDKLKVMQTYVDETTKLIVKLEQKQPRKKE